VGGSTAWANPAEGNVVPRAVRTMSDNLNNRFIGLLPGPTRWPWCAPPFPGGTRLLGQAYLSLQDGGQDPSESGKIQKAGGGRLVVRC
jgi:hypothetical protein